MILEILMLLLLLWGDVQFPISYMTIDRLGLCTVSRLATLGPLVVALAPKWVQAALQFIPVLRHIILVTSFMEVTMGLG